MTASIAFLHTAAVHVPRFDALVQSQSPGTVVHHHVDASLLHDVRVLGVDDPVLVQRVHQAMRAAARSGARVVVCTCSTIGGIAEGMDSGKAFTAMRIDRAMADTAAQSGPRVLLVAALESTLEPTAALLHDSAQRLQAVLHIDSLCIAPAWAFFEQGNTAQYLATIAEATRAAVREHSVVVLAQASMDEAVPLLRDLPIPVLTSPALGVAAALALVASH